MTSEEAHAEALRRLIALDGPLEELVDAMDPYPAYDHPRPVVTLDPAHVQRVLRRYLSRDVAGADVERWADFLELRDDVEADELVLEALRELSTPELFGELTPELARSWIAQLATD